MPKKKEPFMVLGRAADEENEWIPIDASDFEEAEKEAEEIFRKASGNSEVYIEAVVRGRLQVVSGFGHSPVFLEAPPQAELITTFLKQVQLKLERIHRFGQLTEAQEGQENILLKIAIQSAAREMRLVHPDHKRLAEHLTRIT